ncbi:MAG TPA: protein kinase [Kofleriaceae bacterium]|nr:protein kinase [Kofleriaceae bacterium]
MAGTADNSARVRRDDPRRQGRYVLGELLGRGGMAEVFAGNSIGAHGFQKPVAIKRLLPELANDEVFVERLIGEAKLVVGMAHGNIVSVLDLARDGDDVFIVMEFVDGPSLRQLMKARGSRGVSIGVATYVLQAAAAGLEFAHNRPGGAVIHADISPSNILLTTSGEVRVADFGIARREGGGGGVVEGKWAYMAPEQARGEALTPRSDVFALGVVLYELLCGEHPLGRQVTAGERELAPKRIVPPRVVKASIPPGLDTICMKALAYEPHDRFARMQHVIDALVDERFANGYREGANDLAQMIREVMPGTGPAKEQTQHTARPVTIVTRSLISALNLRASSPQVEQNASAADEPVPKIADSAAQTRAIAVDELPADLRPSAALMQRPSATAMHRPEGTPTPELPLGKLKSHMAAQLPLSPLTAAPPQPAVVMTPPPAAFALSPDMLPPPELSSVHGGTFGGSNAGVVAPTRNSRWAAGVLGIAACAGAITAVITKVGNDPELHEVPWSLFTTPIVVVQDPPPAPPPPKPALVVQQPPAPPPPPPAGSAAIAIATAGSGGAGSAVEAAPVPAKSDDPAKAHGSTHAGVAVAPVTAHRDREPSASDPLGTLRLELLDGDFATVTIQNQKRNAPGDKYRLIPGNYTAHVKDPKEGTTFRCPLTVEPGVTTTVNISLKDETCDEEDR